MRSKESTRKGIAVKVTCVYFGFTGEPGAFGSPATSATLWQLKPEARAGSRKSANSLQVAFVCEAVVAVACGGSAAVGVSDATG